MALTLSALLAVREADGHVDVDDALAFAAADPQDIVTRSVYDGAGHVVAAVDPEGRIVEHLFDGAGREVATILPTVDVVDPSGFTGDGPLQPTTLTTYDARGLATLVEDCAPDRNSRPLDRVNE